MFFEHRDGTAGYDRGVNLILVESADFVSKGRVRLCDRRRTHIQKVHRAKIGDRLRMGEVGGKIGEGKVIALDADEVILEVEFDQIAPDASKIILAVALPRPPTLQKVLQHGTAMGIKEFHFFHSRRVEKSFWQSSILEPKSLRQHMFLGLEQARDTALPEIHFHRRFRPFAEEQLTELSGRSSVLVAHPECTQACPTDVDSPTTVVVGPEGGFIPFETDLLRAQDYGFVTLGSRILRVEVATSVLIGRLQRPLVS